MAAVTQVGLAEAMLWIGLVGVVLLALVALEKLDERVTDRRRERRRRAALRAEAWERLAEIERWEEIRSIAREIDVPLVSDAYGAAEANGFRRRWKTLDNNETAG